MPRRSPESPDEKPNASTRVLPGFSVMKGFIEPPAQRQLMTDLAAVVASAPLYRPSMPRSGKPFSIRMTNCGPLGWVSDKAGYRYQPTHPETGRSWPAMPSAVVEIWRQVADYPALPEACLINHYTAGTKLGSHVDADETDMTAPVVSISLGDDAVFHVGGLTRDAPKTRLVLGSGDVVVLGGAARIAYHGIDRIVPGTSDVVPWGGRINLTLRRVQIHTVLA